MRFFLIIRPNFCTLTDFWLVRHVDILLSWTELKQPNHCTACSNGSILLWWVSHQRSAGVHTWQWWQGSSHHIVSEYISDGSNRHEEQLTVAILHKIQVMSKAIQRKGWHSYTYTYIFIGAVKVKEKIRELAAEEWSPYYVLFKARTFKTWGGMFTEYNPHNKGSSLLGYNSLKTIYRSKQGCLGRAISKGQSEHWQSVFSVARLQYILRW